MKTFSQVVFDALADALKTNEGPGAIPMRLAESLRDELRREGYAIHDRLKCHRADQCDHTQCVRPGPPPLGRPYEEVMAGKEPE